MDINFKQKSIWLLPILLGVILALIITFSSNWPLSWDVYTHINYALAYMHYGITTVDPLLNAPNGKTIGYSPLFHIILVVVAYITRLDFITITRIFQIFLAIVTTATIMFVSYKIFDKKTAMFSGLLLVSSFMFMRMLLPIPENLAIIFFSLGVYSFYNATLNKNKYHALVSGIFALLILATHFSSFVYYMILISLLMICQIFIQRNTNSLKSYLWMLVPVICIGILGLIVILFINLSFFVDLLRGAKDIIENPLILFMGQKAMGLERYIKCIGVLPLLFGVIGIIHSFKYKEALFITLWALISFIISNLHWFGIPVYTFRLLIYVIIPAVLIGAYACSKIMDKLKEQNKNYAIIFVISIIVLSFGLGLVNLNDSSVVNSVATTEQSSFQIAPPTSDEEEIITWFNNEDTQNKSILINNLYLGTVISSVDNIPLHYGFDVYTNTSLTKSSLYSLNNQSIGYIVYDKSLIMNNSTDYKELRVQYINGSYYPSYYFTKEITDNNFKNIQLSGTKKVFENNRFIICKVNEY